MNSTKTRPRCLRVHALALLALVVIAEFASALQPGDIPYKVEKTLIRRERQQGPDMPTN